jgi:hypothetical protein
MWGRFGESCTFVIWQTIKFITKTESETASIYLRFKDGAAFDLTAKTNYKINSNNWSKTKGQPKNLKDADSKKLDSDLVDLRAKLLGHYNNTANKSEINTQWLKDFINPNLKMLSRILWLSISPTTRNKNVIL